MILEHMEWSLKTLLEKKDLSMKSRIFILIDLVTALIALHEKEIVHLDLNWNNILLNVESSPRDNSRKYHTKIADFGTSAFVGKNIKYGKTPFFVAPEMRECEKNEAANDLKVEAPLTAKCSIDMWNFGVIALLLIGKKETWEAWQKVCKKKELFPNFSLRGSEVYTSLINEAITSNLYTIPIKTIVVNVIDHCLKIDPEKRITAIKAKEELVKAQEMLNEIYKGIS
jgi:serine/threonine protein kinase